MSDNLDINIYKLLHNDLKNMNEIELIDHYKNYGFNEGRIGNQDQYLKFFLDFDINFYKTIHEDLNNMTNNELLNHYYNHGKNEGRLKNEQQYLYFLKIYNVIFKIFNINYNKISSRELHSQINGFVNLLNKKKNINELVLNNDFKLQNLNKDEIISYFIKYNILDYDSYIENNNVYHLTHNFGGGTNIYVDNIQKIFPNYNHIIINIIDQDYIIINNDLKIDKSFIKNIINTKGLLIVHHLLYYDKNDDCTRIASEILDTINSINMIKIFIVHDYFLFNQFKPNPIKSEISQFLSDNLISKIKIFFSNFDKIFFNSINCYNNYLKYIPLINNSTILNVVPDISYYSNRIFPIRKEKYNIGIIGRICCTHKGIFIADKIINIINNNYENKYKFIIIGTSNLHKNNLVVTGEYNNNNIFSLINEHDIDYFLFLSAFEETYSFTLSIALHTGLPIIYNNIGSYSERLANYNNCYPFLEDNCEDIINILNNIDENTNIIRSEKNRQLIYPNLYNNIPEFSKFLKIDNNLNFDIKEITKNLKNGIVCFIHICNINGDQKGINIFNDQLKYIKKSGLYDKLDYIFITLLGKNFLLTHDYKVKVIYYSENQLDMEFPIIQRIKYFADNILKNIKILYIHTKGVTNKQHSHEWRKYLEYFLIEHNNLCLNALTHYKCVGVNHQYYYNQNKYKNHFSGNFWWSNSNYIKTLPFLEKDIDRYLVEHWLIGNLDKNDYRYFLSLHHTNINFYHNHLNEQYYNLELIKSKINNNLIKKYYLKNRKIIGVIYICCIGLYIDYLNNYFKKLIESGLYDISDKILCFVCLKSDDCINLLKKFNKVNIISTNQNLYEKFAINNLKKYLSGDYYLYYIHSKGITRSKQCFRDWLNLCEYFTIKKWRLSVELLNYYDCVGTNLKNFPKKHYSGNFWWSKSEHINTLPNINDAYLSSEMYICSHIKTNYVSIYQSYVNHGDTEYNESIYNTINDNDLINNFCIIPDFNCGDKICIKKCGDIKPNFEPAILELE